VRAFEALRAGRELGLENGDEAFLGYPDFGTLEIWENRWGPDREAFRSMFSEEASVPYWFAETPGAPYKGESILADLKGVIADFKPTKIFVSHPGDTNPDHVAYGLYLRTALWDLKDVVQPEVYHFLTHYGEWPQPRGLYFDAPHEPPAQFDEPGRWVTLPLQPDQVRHKLDALKRHKTQYDASREYLESYMRANELFDRFEEIALTADAPAVTILPSGRAVAGSTPPADSPAVGLPRFARVEGTDLVLGAPSADWQGAVRLMGYRADRPFEEMPKIAVDLRAGDDYSVSERKAWVAPDSVQLTRGEGLTELRVPLALLGNPERLHLNMEIKPAEGPLDPMPWVALTLPQP
jgi:LmbE family N-acetylglucosaminyl deacetylase